MNAVAWMLMEAYEESELNKPTIADAKSMIQKDYILNHVEYQVINAEANAELLQKIPHKNILDLAAVYRVIIPVTGVASSYLVSNAIMEYAGISQEELDEAAYRNTLKTGFYTKTLYQMAEDNGVSPECFVMPDGCTEMYILSSNKTAYGASIILFNNELAKAAEKIGDDIYLIPSSISEFLAVPTSGLVDAEDLKPIIQSINDNVLADELILGYSVYKYSRETGKVEVAA